MKKKKHLQTSVLTLIGGVIILIIKFLAWRWTNSNAILTDALESIINIVAGVFALYSLSLSLIPKDKNHPYGHGKIEFISAGFEGALILIAGLSIIIKSIYDFFSPHEVSQLDVGLWITAISGVANYIMGYFLAKEGRKISSLTLTANGKHLMSDAYSSLGLMIGIGTVMVTGWDMLDNVVAILFGIIIIVTGYKLFRESISGIMDEADSRLIAEFVKEINKHRKEDWIDIHNLRIIKYGSSLHVDCHLTLPWYYSTEESHDKMKEFEDLVKNISSRPVELFIHVDPCKPISCKICQKENCPQRTTTLEKYVEWTPENVTTNINHSLL